MQWDLSKSTTFGCSGVCVFCCVPIIACIRDFTAVRVLTWYVGHEVRSVLVRKLFQQAAKLTVIWYVASKTFCDRVYFLKRLFVAMVSNLLDLLEVNLLIKQNFGMRIRNFKLSWIMENNKICQKKAVEWDWNEILTWKVWVPLRRQRIRRHRHQTPLPQQAPFRWFVHSPVFQKKCKI